jgi:electron transfer flavoprotein-quinone oxidoreductase
MAEQVDVIVVGAGLAGLGAAYHLAGEGLEVLVVERGDYPGAKNVSGGRLYLDPVRPLYPQLFAEGELEHEAVERRVIKEGLAMLSDDCMTSLEFRSDEYVQGPAHSVTLLRGRFDRWLGERVAERGAIVVPGYKVDDLVWDGGQVVGIQSAGDEVRSRVVLAADGALSFMAERAGLRGRFNPDHYALGIKEVVELPPGTIEDRFLVGPGQGAAQLFFGSISQGMLGGGFLYTNRDSLSVGLVLGMADMVAAGGRARAHEIMNAFKGRAELDRLLAGGRVVEYSAHAIPETSHRDLKRLSLGGLLVLGDAAGLSLNMGISVRGMDFALASGAYAAETVRAAFDADDFSAPFLSRYDSALRESFVLQDQVTFAGMHEFLKNPRLYNEYPVQMARLFRRLFHVGAGPKERFWPAIWRTFRELSLGDALRDLWKIRGL